VRGSAYIWSFPDPDRHADSYTDQHADNRTVADEHADSYTDQHTDRYSDLRDRDAAADGDWRTEPEPDPDLRAAKHGDQHASAERDADQHVTRADQHAEAPAADPADYGAARADPADGW